MEVHLTGSLMLETVIRFISVGLYLATAIVILRLRLSPSRIAGTAAYLSKACHVVVQFPPALALSGLVSPVIVMAGTMGAVLTWLFAIELYSDQARFDRRRLIPVAFVLVIVFAAATASPETAQALWLLHSFTTVGLMTHLLGVLASSWKNDLVERRRLIATPVFAISAIYSISLGFIQSIRAFDDIPRQPSLFNAFLLLFLSSLAIIIFGQYGAVLFGDETDDVIVHVKASRTTPDPTLSVSDTNLITTLEQLMQTEKLYRTQSLKITDLASCVRVPEHRLRQLLNHKLGYRNFNAYIGHWRIDEAKAALADPEQLEVPISTIAIDSGFQSLAPFNRAFKSETGMTPSEYRADAESKWTSPTAPVSSPIS